MIEDAQVADVAVVEAAELLATVTGQDVEAGADGVFRIARRVAEDRVISVVDPDAGRGHKTSARGFDGYKGHIAIDPDSEVVTQPRSVRRTAATLRPPQSCWPSLLFPRPPTPTTQQTWTPPRPASPTPLAQTTSVACRS
ncbi:MAG: hypothetical protein ACRDYA_11380 [Egibacteraceae bacterium]